MICLLPHAYKMISTLLLHRLRLECEGFLKECQAGFRQHMGCRDQIIILAEMIAQIQELGHARAKASIDPAAEVEHETQPSHLLHVLHAHSVVGRIARPLAQLPR